MYKIGIIGARDSVLGFLAIGFTTLAVSDEQEAKVALKKLVDDNCAVVFITEEYSEKIAEDIAKYKDQPTPAIVVIPGVGGSMGLGMAALKSASERAIGADILFKEN